MSRTEILKILDGTHPRHGRTGAWVLHLFILMSTVSLTVETMDSVAPPVVRVLDLFEMVIVLVFTIEYLTRLICAPHPLRYALSFWGIVDLLACLPILSVLHPQWSAIRGLRVLRLVRLLKLMRTAHALQRLSDALSSVRADLIVFAMLAASVLYIAALGIYIFEHDVQPDVFGSIPESLWWAVVSFTTVGYGDSYPITAAGRIFTAAILFVGLGVIAVPAAVITSALIDQTRQERDRKEHNDTSQHSKPAHHLRPRHGRGNHGTGRRP